MHLPCAPPCRKVARFAGEDKALSLQTHLMLTLNPLHTLATMINEQPAWPEFNNTFQRVAGEAVANDNSIMDIHISPLGVIQAVYPSCK